MADYSNLPDQALVELLKQGDHAAFIEIFDRYYILLFSFTCRRLNDKEDSKDLVHDAFAAIWEKRDTIVVMGELVAYLFTVVKNRILDRYKHAKITQKYADSFHRYVEESQDQTDHLVRHNELRTLIEKEIAALPEKMRLVFELRTSMNRKEISVHLGLPENTVKTNMHRALTILRKKLSFLNPS